MISSLNLLIDILTVIVGIFSVVSISVVGVQYLMAGRNEAKVKKVKHRMFEIIIGLTAYATVTVVLKWIQFLIMK